MINLGLTTKSTYDRLKSARIDRHWCERFMAVAVFKWIPADGQIDKHDHSYMKSEEFSVPVLGPIGGKQPSTFKTLRNARKAAGEGGFVFQFDIASLPIIADDATHDEIDLGNELDEEAFAERQMLYWERELSAIRARKP